MPRGPLRPEPEKRSTKQSLPLSERYQGHTNPEGLEDLVGVSDIATHLNVGSTAVSNWVARHSDFPRPAIIAGQNRKQTGLWKLSEVDEWHRGRHEG